MATNWLENTLTRRSLLKSAAAIAGAGVLSPVLQMLSDGKTLEAAYPEELLSIEKYTKGAVKPGDIVSRHNAELVKDICPDGLYIELTRGREIKIAETTLTPSSFIPEYYIHDSLRNNGRGVLDGKGNLWTKEGKPWIGGDPFPEAKTALEAMWNHFVNFHRVSDMTWPGTVYEVDRQGRVLRKLTDYYYLIQTNARPVGEPGVPGYSDELYRITITFLTPFDLFGFATLTPVPYDNTRFPGLTAYIPALRRLRELPVSERFEPAWPYGCSYISEINIHNDPLLLWSWQIVGRKPMLQPAPVNAGAWAKEATKDDFVFPLAEVKYPRTTWELRPEVLLVDGVTNLEGCPYSKRRMYIDVVTWRAPVADEWDKRNAPWRYSMFAYTPLNIPDGAGGNKMPISTGIEFVDLQKDYRDLIWSLPQIGTIKLAVNTGLAVQNYCTPNALLRFARR